MSTEATRPWRVDAARFPRDAEPARRLEFLLQYAVLAPSGHNTQPWRFRVVDDAVEVRADRSRSLPVVDPHDRELTISCGAAVGALEVALRRFGHTPEVAALPDPADADLLARVAPGAACEPSNEDMALFDAIPARRTDRSAFADQPLPGAVIRRCRDACARHGVELAALARDEQRLRVAELVAEGDRAQFADAAFRRELASWIHSQGLGARDGISAAGMGMPDVLSPVGALVVRTFDVGKGVAASDRDLIASGSPCLMLLATEDDGPGAWIETGRALMHALLTLTANGQSASWLNQPIEVESLRPRVREAAGVSGWPQILLRAGRGGSVAPAARRPVDEVLDRD